MSISFKLEELTAEAFSEFGEVIEKGRTVSDMNAGMADNYRALATVDIEDEDLAEHSAQAVISIVTSRQYQLPHSVNLVERHPLGSQAFIPQSDTPFIVIVAKAGEFLEAKQLRVFKTNGFQGINYYKGTWHSPLLTPYGEMDFICVDRFGGGNNCDVIKLPETDWLLIE